MVLVVNMYAWVVGLDGIDANIVPCNGFSQIGFA